MQIVFAVLLGALALWAIAGAIRGYRASGTGAAGLGLIAVAAVVQIVNILGTYSLALSIGTTVLILAGFALSRRAIPAP
jgi:hypothetical protein